MGTKVFWVRVVEDRRFEDPETDVFRYRPTALTDYYYAAEQGFPAPSS